MQLPIYLDHHATTPMDTRVVEAMKPFFCDQFGNAGSAHCYGRAVREACDNARDQLHQLLKTEGKGDIVITSGATESNNMVIKGVSEGLSDLGRHIITCATEHPAVLAPCRYLESKGYEVTFLPVDKTGQVAPEVLRAAIRSGSGGVNRTILVSIMGANNEIGTIHQSKQLAAICRDDGVLFHVDGAQTVGKTAFNAFADGVDFVSLSGHKIYGPKGIGALWVGSERQAKESMIPLFHGGGQEAGLRSGTLPVALLIGLGKAAELCRLEMDEENERLRTLRERLVGKLSQAKIPFELNGHPTERLAGNLHLTFFGIDSELLALAFRDIAVSSTSACSASKNKPSHVLKALGRTDDEAFSSVRFGLGRKTTADEIDFVAARIEENFKKFGQKKKHENSPFQGAVANSQTAGAPPLNTQK